MIFFITFFITIINATFLGALVTAVGCTRVEWSNPSSKYYLLAKSANERERERERERESLTPQSTIIWWSETALWRQIELFSDDTSIMLLACLLFERPTTNIEWVSEWVVFVTTRSQLWSSQDLINKYSNSSAQDYSLACLLSLDLATQLNVAWCRQACCVNDADWLIHFKSATTDGISRSTISSSNWCLEWR